MIVQYLVDHPRPDCFAREIPLPVSTKLIEENRPLLSAWLDCLLPASEIDFAFSRGEFEQRYGLRFARQHLLIRCLDSDLQSRLGLPFSELSLPAESISHLCPQGAAVFVVENKVNLLTLPKVRNGIAIGGLGKAISLLRDVRWLQSVPLFYWGDIDVEGFDMLGQFRTMFDKAQSLLMDISTLDRHIEFAAPWPNQQGKPPQNLFEPEQAAYDYLLRHRIRLEQEHIPQTSVYEQIHALGFID